MRRQFPDRGFHLFRSEQNFGIRDTPDRIAAWVRALDRDQPFVLTGIGFDWIEGRFTPAIRDPGALARRFYACCPDIVDQGTETLAALANELRRSHRLYCWWD